MFCVCRDRLNVVQFWPTVYDVAPTSVEHWFNDSCLLGRSYYISPVLNIDPLSGNIVVLTNSLKLFTGRHTVVEDLAILHYMEVSFFKFRCHKLTLQRKCSELKNKYHKDVIEII